jgi:hypothetical protein
MPPKKRGPVFEVSITSLLPLPRDQAQSVATMRHVMDKIKATLIQCRLLVLLAADHPIYALEKHTQQSQEILNRPVFVLAILKK